MRTLSCGWLLVVATTLGCQRREQAAERPPPRSAIVVQPVDGRCPEALERTRDDPETYVPPSDAERSAMREGIAHLLDDDLAGAARELGTIGLEIVPAADTFLVREATRRRGAGAYLLRRRRASAHEATARLVVQAPHTFFDEGTLPLACELFARGHGLALYINTAHRSRGDVAHTRSSLFQAATEGLLRARAAQRPVVVQLHGFGERDGDSAVVLSPGSHQPGLASVADARAALVRVIDGGVSRFPEDMNELGATTNVQGALVRAAGGVFLHVELGAPLRHALLADALYRASVLSTLADALEGT